MDEVMHHSIVTIKRIDQSKRIAFGEVYAPDVLDTYTEFMFASDVETMCHRFAELKLSETIDTNHDNEPNGSWPVESFIARGADPDFREGTWVLGIKVPDDHLWAQITKGELNGFSFEALVRPVDVVAKVDVIRDRVGQTEPPTGLDEDHDHVFFVEVNEAGRVVRGSTSMNEGHFHTIVRGTSTQPGDSNRHTHRFFL